MVESPRYLKVLSNDSDDGVFIKLAFFFTQTAIRGMIGACILAFNTLSEAKDVVEPLVHVRAAAATTLKVLHLLVILGPGRSAVWTGGAPLGMSSQPGLPLAQDMLRMFGRCAEDILGLSGLSTALALAEAPVLRWLEEECRVPYAEEDQETAIAMWCAVMELGKLAEAAETAQPKDEAVAVVRAKLLAADGDCAYLGCKTVEKPEADGVVPKSKRLCSGCSTVRYCSAVCQRADWKAHKIACKAIQAERQG